MRHLSCVTVSAVTLSLTQNNRLLLFHMSDADQHCPCGSLSASLRSVAHEDEHEQHVAAVSCCHDSFALYVKHVRYFCNVICLQPQICHIHGDSTHCIVQ